MLEPYTETNAGLHYDLRLDLDPPNQHVAVSGSLAYHSPQAGLERARFYLHRQFTIQRLKGRRVFGYSFETAPESNINLLPQAGILDIYFSPTLEKYQTALVQFEYQGILTDWPAESANLVTPGWTELGMYLPWFPLQYNGTASSLTFTLKVTCPPQYQVGSYGQYALADGGWFFNWPHPTNDIVVVAGTNLKSRLFESDTNRVFLNSATFDEAASHSLGEEMLWVLERFSGWFGPTRPSDFTLIESPRALGGGYARRGIIVLSGLSERDYLEQREAYLRYLAHEAAHAWWWDSPTGTWEDWLNEGFAEYSGLLAVRERFGAGAFERFLDRKRERSLNIQPLWEFDRSDVSTIEKQALVESLLYDKGPLLLHALTERIGYQRFLELCRARLWSGVTSTRHFLDLLEEIEGRETRLWMEERLKT